MAVQSCASPTLSPYVTPTFLEIVPAVGVCEQGDGRLLWPLA